MRRSLSIGCRGGSPAANVARAITTDITRQATTRSATDAAAPNSHVAPTTDPRRSRPGSKCIADRLRRSCLITRSAVFCAGSTAWPISTPWRKRSTRSFEDSPGRRYLTSSFPAHVWMGIGMIEPYTAVGLIPSFWGIRRRVDIEKNLEHLESLTKAAFWLSNLDIPVRLVAIPEGALQGFNDEVLDVDHAEFARNCAIDIPGPETDRLGRLARNWGVFIMAQAKARHEDWPDRFFNIGFIVDPDGAVVLKHYKISALLPCERSVSPHDLFDWWVDKYGRN